MSLALINGKVLSDAGFEAGRVVVLSAGRIEAVIGHDQWQAERARRDGKQSVYDLQGRRLVPGFVDTQVNGGGGVLFNDDPSVDSIVEIGRAHRRYGTTGFLPTLISDDLDVVMKAVRAVQTAMEIGVPGVLGIHIEGPYLNEERKGVHDVTKLRWLDEDALDLLTSLNGGRTLVTLAPERTSPQVIRKLADAGIIISAAHQRHVRRDQGCTVARSDWFHAPVQRDVAAHRPRAGCSRRRARRPGQLVRHHRRWSSGGSGRAAHCLAQQAAGSLHAGDGCHAQRRRAKQGIQAARPADFGLRQHVAG
jgi:hypothetical protein